LVTELLHKDELMESEHGEFVRIYKETVDYFKILSWHLSEVKTLTLLVVLYGCET